MLNWPWKVRTAAAGRRRDLAELTKTAEARESQGVQTVLDENAEFMAVDQQTVAQHTDQQPRI